MAYNSKNVKWYLAELVEEIETEGESENVVHNNLVLIRADSPEEAYIKAMARGQELNDDYDNLAGQQVIVTFRGLSDLNPILDELEDGTEIAYEELRGLSAADIAEMLPAKEELGIFQALETESHSVETSKALLEEAMRIIRNAENEA